MNTFKAQKSINQIRHAIEEYDKEIGEFIDPHFTVGYIKGILEENSK